MREREGGKETVSELHRARARAYVRARARDRKKMYRMSFHFSILFLLLVFSLSLSRFLRVTFFPLCVCVLWVHAQHHARDSTPHEARSRHERNHKKDNNKNRDVLVVSPNNGL